jgi:hypothetical protein
MTSLTLNFVTSGDTFGDDPETETARVLTVVQDKIASGRLHPGAEPLPLRDLNGNTIGTATWHA